LRRPHARNADRASFARLQQAFLTKCGHGSGRCSRPSITVAYLI
jgi:hypothetical protein